MHDHGNCERCAAIDERVRALEGERDAAREALGAWSKHEIGQTLMGGINNLRQVAMTASDNAEAFKARVTALEVMLAKSDAVIAGHWYGHGSKWRLEDQAQPVQDAILRHRARGAAALRAPSPTSDAGETAKQQIDRLASFIMEQVPGEPSQNEGAVDTAIRLLRAPSGSAPPQRGVLLSCPWCGVDLHDAVVGATVAHLIACGDIFREQHRHVPVPTRAQVLEEACLAICFRCRRGDRLEFLDTGKRLHREDERPNWHHEMTGEHDGSFYEGAWTLCDARAIRALLAPGAEGKGGRG